MLRSVPLIVLLLFAPALAAAQQPCTTDARRVVDELYRHILERGADAGSAGFVQRLENGGSVRDVVRDIAKSAEHRQRFFNAQENDAYIRAVGTLYRHVLGRQPDPDGARGFAEMARNKGFEAVVDSLVASNEYQNAFGDWGVPGSGGVRYCGGNQAQSSQSSNQNQYQYNMRFREMDTNNDGVVSRGEWRGSNQSFRVHDWNNDGVLSGDEVRPGYRRDDRSLGDENFDRQDRFEYLDVNNNNRIERREWHGTAEAFDWLDRNNDNVLTRAEFLDDGRAVSTSGQTIFVDPKNRWTDTGIDVQAGDTVNIDAEGRIQLSTDPNDTAGPAGSVSGRRAARAPLPRTPAGALVARIGNSNVLNVGTNGSLGRVPVSGRLYLGVNDDYLADNTGEFRVNVEVQ
jgi:Ca2+-binding EF-hand superfamily protein